MNIEGMNFIQYVEQFPIIKVIVFVMKEEFHSCISVYNRTVDYISLPVSPNMIQLCMRKTIRSLETTIRSTQNTESPVIWYILGDISTGISSNYFDKIVTYSICENGFAYMPLNDETKQRLYLDQTEFTFALLNINAESLKRRDEIFFYEAHNTGPAMTMIWGQDFKYSHNVFIHALSRMLNIGRDSAVVAMGEDMTTAVSDMDVKNYENHIVRDYDDHVHLFSSILQNVCDDFDVTRNIIVIWCCGESVDKTDIDTGRQELCNDVVNVMLYKIPFEVKSELFMKTISINENNTFDCSYKTLDYVRNINISIIEQV